MANVYTVKFEPWHYEVVVNSGKLIAELSGRTPMPQLEWLAANSYSWTICVEDVIAGVLFGSEIVSGNVQLNMIVTSDIKPLCVLRKVTRIFRELMDNGFSNGIHRLQCEVVFGFEEAKRLVEHFGFKSEGLMCGYYSKDVDVERFAIVRR